MCPSQLVFILVVYIYFNIQKSIYVIFCIKRMNYTTIMIISVGS